MYQKYGSWQHARIHIFSAELMVAWEEDHLVPNLTLDDVKTYNNFRLEADKNPIIIILLENIASWKRRERE